MIFSRVYPHGVLRVLSALSIPEVDFGLKEWHDCLDF